MLGAVYVRLIDGDQYPSLNPRVRLGILRDISQAGKNSVATILGVGPCPIIQYQNEPSSTKPRRTVSVPIRIGSSDKYHFLLPDEFDHSL
jgi:hypothetical protein